MKPIFTVLMLLFLSALVVSSWKAWEQANAYQSESREIERQLGTNGRLESKGKELLEKITLGLYQGGSERLEQLREQQTRLSALQRSAWLLTAIFFALVFPFLVCVYFIRRDRLDLAYAVLTLALGCLVLGLVLPVLSISVSGDLPLLGKTVLQYRSKGVLSTITGLWGTGNAWLAVLLFLFSILLPISKTLLAGVALFIRTHPVLYRGLRLSRSIGKWSMADVFVAALLVVFFASQGEDMTDAKLQVGICFFAGYVVLSLLGTQLIAHSLTGKTGHIT